MRVENPFIPDASRFLLSASHTKWMWSRWTEKWQMRNPGRWQPAKNARLSALQSFGLRRAATSGRTRAVTCTGVCRLIFARRTWWTKRDRRLRPAPRRAPPWVLKSSGTCRRLLRFRDSAAFIRISLIMAPFYKQCKMQCVYLTLRAARGRRRAEVAAGPERTTKSDRSEHCRESRGELQHGKSPRCDHRLPPLMPFEPSTTGSRRRQSRPPPIPRKGGWTLGAPTRPRPGHAAPRRAKRSSEIDPASPAGAD